MIERLNRYLAATRRSQWIGAAALLLAGVIGLYAYNRCYCSFAGDRGGALQIDSVPNSCVVLDTPEPWQTPDGELANRSRPVSSSAYHDVFNNYEIRRSRTESLLYIALKSKQATGYGGLPAETGTRYSLNRFAFEIRTDASKPGPRAGLQSLRKASDQEWEEAEPLEFHLVGDPAASSPELSPPAMPPFSAPKSVKLAARTRIWGGPSDGMFSGVFYNPPAYASAMFYTSGTPWGEVMVWACGDPQPFIHDAAVHGDTYFTLAMNQNERRVLLCRR